MPQTRTSRGGLFSAKWREIERRLLEAARSEAAEFALRHIAPALPFVGPVSVAARARQLAGAKIRDAIRPPESRPRNAASDARFPSASGAARAVASKGAQAAGILVGTAAGAANTLQDLVHGAHFVSRLADPFDWVASRPGEAAWDKVGTAGRQVSDYAARTVDDPEQLARDVGDQFHQLRLRVDPTASPKADTFKAEVRRNYDIGRNQGKLAFDLGTLAIGGPALKGASRLGAASRPMTAAEWASLGFGPTQIADLMSPYVRPGHHFLPQSKARELDIPSVIAESPVFVLKPRGITKGDFYKLHYQVDRDYHGGRVAGQRWSGKALGWNKYGRAGRLWHGSPRPLKATLGGAVGAAGAGGVGAYEYLDEDER